MGWDPDLLQRFRDGDPEALAEIFRAHAEGLTRVLRAKVFGREFPRLRWQVDIENTVLETFARAFEPRARAVYDGVRPYAHFLTGIARNVLYEQARSREFASGLSPDELHSHPQGTEPDQEAASSADLYEDRELLTLLSQFEQQLDADERALFALRVEQSMAQEAAAEQLGLSRIQLRRRELALKKKLVAFLGTHGYLGEVELRQWTFVRRAD